MGRIVFVFVLLCGTAVAADPTITSGLITTVSEAYIENHGGETDSIRSPVSGFGTAPGWNDGGPLSETHTDAVGTSTASAMASTYVSGSPGGSQAKVEARILLRSTVLCSNGDNTVVKAWSAGHADASQLVSVHGGDYTACRLKYVITLTGPTPRYPFAQMEPSMRVEVGDNVLTMTFETPVAPDWERKWKVSGVYIDAARVTRNVNETIISSNNKVETFVQPCYVFLDDTTTDGTFLVEAETVDAVNWSQGDNVNLAESWIFGTTTDSLLAYQAYAEFQEIKEQ